jgi:hypothetical protein
MTSLLAIVSLSFVIASTSSAAYYSVDNVEWSFDGMTIDFSGQGHADEYSGHYWQYRLGVNWGDGSDPSEIWYWPDCISQGCPNEPPTDTDWESPGYPTPNSARWIYQKISNKDYLDAQGYFTHQYTEPGCYRLTFYISHSQVSGAEGADATYTADYYIVGDKTVCDGSSETFSVTACDPTGSYTYAWYRITDSGDVLVGTGSTLTTSIAGDYYVLVTRVGGTTVRSNTFSLNVNPYPEFMDNPVGSPVEGQPDDVNGCSGGSATFEVIMDPVDSGQYSYQWQYRTSSNEDPDFGWLDISGANGKSYTVDPIDGKDGYQYRVKVWFGSITSCYIYSNAATLTIANGVTTTDPLDTTVCVTDLVNFMVTAGGTGPFSYEWEYSTDDGENYYLFPESTNNPQLQFTAISGYNGYLFRAIVSGYCGSATSNAAKLTVVEAPIASIIATISA